MPTQPPPTKPPQKKTQRELHDISAAQMKTLKILGQIYSQEYN